MRKRFVSWAAVSSLPQTKKISLEDQLRVNHEHIARLDGELVADLVVRGESRDIVLFEDACREIEAYAQLHDLINNKAFDVLIFLKRSRLGRTVALCMTIVELCYRSGIVIYETESPPSTLTPYGATHSDLLISAIKSVDAQNEITEFKRRNEFGILDRVSKGEWAYGGVPYGWIVRYAEDGTLIKEIDQGVKRVLDIIIEMYLLRNEGTPAIAAELNRRKIPPPSGRIWYKSSIRWIITKSYRYAGYSEVNVNSKTGRPYLKAKSTWPPLITEAQAIAIFAERKLRLTAKRAISNTYRYSLCVWCDTCGHRMVAQVFEEKRGDKVRRREQYRCTHHAGLGKFISAPKIDAALNDVVNNLRSGEIKNYLPNGNDAISIISSQIELANKQIKQANESMQRADDAYVTGIMSNDRYRHQIERIKEQIDQLNDEIYQLNGRLIDQSHLEKRKDRIEDIRINGLNMLTNPDVKVANAWIRNVFKIYIKDCQVVRVEIV